MSYALEICITFAHRLSRISASHCGPTGGWRTRSSLHHNFCVSNFAEWNHLNCDHCIVCALHFVFISLFFFFLSTAAVDASPPVLCFWRREREKKAHTIVLILFLFFLSFCDCFECARTHTQTHGRTSHDLTTWLTDYLWIISAAAAAGAKAAAAVGAEATAR